MQTHLTVNVSNFKTELISAIQDQGKVYNHSQYGTIESKRTKKIQRQVNRCYDLIFDQRQNILIPSPLLVEIRPKIEKLSKLLKSSIVLVRLTNHEVHKELVTYEDTFARFVTTFQKMGTNSYILKITKPEELYFEDSQSQEPVFETVLHSGLTNVTINCSNPNEKDGENTHRVGPLTNEQIQLKKKKKSEKKKTKKKRKKRFEQEENLENLSDVEKHGFTSGHGMLNTKAILDRMKQSESYRSENTINLFSEGLEKIIPIFEVLTELAQKIMKSSQYAKVFLHGDDLHVACSMCPLHCPHRFSISKFKPRGRPNKGTKRRRRKETETSSSTGKKF